MGIYFLAAGSKSRARDTLERPTPRALLDSLLPEELRLDLRACFGEGEAIYVWGTMEGGRSALEQLRRGEYVVDVDGADVVQVFEFALAFAPDDTRLQEALAWTDGGAKPFTRVMLLRRPRKPRESRRGKSFFQHAFGFDKPNWLSRSRYFDSETVAAAMARCNADSVEAFLGIEAVTAKTPAAPPKQDRAAPPQALAAPREDERAAPSPGFESREARRQALLEELRRDWRTAGVNLLDASARLLELATRAVKRTDARLSRKRDPRSR